MIADKVKKNIEEKKLIDKGDMVVLGLSGGPDSVCLFSILQGLRDKIGLSDSKDTNFFPAMGKKLSFILRRSSQGLKSIRSTVIFPFSI